MNFADRLRLLMKPDQSVRAFAREIQQPPNTVRDWLITHSRPDLDRLKTVADSLNVSVAWLGWGEGPIRRWVNTSDTAEEDTP